MIQLMPHHEAVASAFGQRGVQRCSPRVLAHFSPSHSRPSLFAGD